MSTQENNKLIAEFMGLHFSKGEYYRPLYNSGDWISENELQFYEEWNWLMTVVDKIEDMGCEVVITNGECTISGDDCYVESIGKSRRGATYDAVVKFINQ